MAEIEPYYQRQAKEFVDFLYDSGCLNPDLSRDAIQKIEDYVAYLYQSAVEMSVKAQLMLAKLKRRNREDHQTSS